MENQKTPEPNWIDILEKVNDLEKVIEDVSSQLQQTTLEKIKGKVKLIKTAVESHAATQQALEPYTSDSDEKVNITGAASSGKPNREDVSLGGPGSIPPNNPNQIGR